MGNVRFGAASSRNITFNELDDSGYSVEEWAEMSDAEKDQAMEEWLFGNSVVECWAEGPNGEAL